MLFKPHSQENCHSDIDLIHFILTPSVKFQQHLWSSFTDSKNPQVHTVGHPICSVGCADEHTERRTSEWQGEWQITKKLLYLINWNCLLHLLPRYTDKNCAIAFQFNPFLPYFFVRLRRFSGGAERIRSSYWPHCKTSFVCDFVLSSEPLRRMNVGANFHP